MAPEARYFLAHSRQTPDADIDNWAVMLSEVLDQPGWDTKVISGRDDFMTRAAGLGGWKAWSRDVPAGSRWDGEALFHGIVVPLDDVEDPVVGKATADLVDGFLREGKHAFVWTSRDNSFAPIEDVTKLPGNSFKAAAILKFRFP